MSPNEFRQMLAAINDAKSFCKVHLVRMNQVIELMKKFAAEKDEYI